jgi:two-component system nitrate/nitrite response regulator NarL
MGPGADTASGRSGSDIAVVVVGSIRLYSEGLARLIEGESGVKVVGVAFGWEHALALVRTRRPEVAIVDVSPPAALTAVRRLTSVADAVPVVGLGLTESEHDIVSAAEAGVAGFLTTGATVADLIAAAKSIRAGELLCSPRVAAILRRRVTALARTRDPEPTRLTAREGEIVALIEAGLTNREIAHHLCIELSTVKNHVHNMFEKLQVHHRGDLPDRVRSELAAAPDV